MPHAASQGPGRRLLVTGLVVAAAWLLASASLALAHETDPCRTVPLDLACSGTAGNSGHVTRAGAEFQLGTPPFRFVGTNAYFLHDAASYGSDKHVWKTMHPASDLGFTVVRMWGPTPAYPAQ